jgi:hypothetical protein
VNFEIWHFMGVVSSANRVFVARFGADVFLVYGSHSLLAFHEAALNLAWFASLTTFQVRFLSERRELLAFELWLNFVNGAALLLYAKLN